MEQNTLCLTFFFFKEDEQGLRYSWQIKEIIDGVKNCVSAVSVDSGDGLWIW